LTTKTATHTAEWYDAAYLEYPLYADTPMRHMYQQVAKMIPRTAPVIDLGCGNGYLASALQEANYTGEYTGLDYSPVAVELARAALTKDNFQLQLFEIIEENPYSFYTQDLTIWEPEVTGDTHKSIYTCFEVLEHVEDDKDIVSRVPARSRFIFSVPNYWSRSHVRTYDSVGVAYDRFSPFLKFAAWYILPTKQPEAAIYLYDTYRRADKW
jgi:2-polyprenyl-3-methyl-5-hydroxy-6-metoxy-1,4-benzoquinol methylase